MLTISSWVDWLHHETLKENLKMTTTELTSDIFSYSQGSLIFRPESREQNSLKVETDECIVTCNEQSRNCTAL